MNSIVSKGRLGGTGLLNKGLDFIAGQGMDQARDVSQKGRGLIPFGGVQAGRSRYNTGSHVDVSSVSLLAGLARGTDIAPGLLLLGAFFEYGTGSYDTHCSFADSDSVKGEGDMRYYGGGVLGRLDANWGGYVEGSLRAGSLRNEYRGNDLPDAMGNSAHYDSSTAYYGLHAGLGYIWNITEQASLDLYGKYFWTRQDSESVTLSTGCPVNFKAVDSHRLRLGSRFAYAVNESFSPYIGAALEHKFDGRAKATSYGHSLLP
jgi:outer membrane autotransporter protein